MTKNLHMSKIYKLQVPEPCHEDFSKMTPKDNGSFCGSCEKVVVDFSKMSDKEVADYISANSDKKICGRFANTQLNRPVGGTVPALQAFVASLLLVFGAALFEFTYVPGSFDAMFKGSSGRTTEAPLSQEGYTVGAPPPVPQMEIADTEVITEIRSEVMGGMVADITDSMVEKQLSEVPVKDVSVISCTVGGMGWTIVEPEQLPIVPEVKTDSFYLAKEEKPSLPNDAVIPPTLESFPNPTNGNINIRYMLPAQMDVTIELYDLNGNKMMDLVSTPSMYEGTYIYPADLSSLANGLYICRMVAGEQVFTTKIILNK